MKALDNKVGRDRNVKNIIGKRPHGIIMASLMFGLFITLAGCGHSNMAYNSNPNVYLVKQLATKRIVMLADFNHSAPLPFKTLIAFLNEWVDQAASGKSADTDVVLFLEDDSSSVNKLKSFISTDNWQPLVNYWLPFNTMEWLEFCSDLRDLTVRIDSLNNRPGLNHKIRFDIQGAESSNFLDTPASLKVSKAQGVKYFVNVRDSLTALNVYAYLDSRAKAKAIFFYGTNHLIGKYVHKNVAGSLPRSETGGHYLAYYLKQRFAPDSVLTVCQISPYRLNKSISFFHVALDSDIFFPSREVTSKDVLLPGLQPQDFDGFITRHELNIPGHLLRDVFSKEIINADIARLKFLKEYFPGYKAEEYYNEVLSSLRLLTGKDFAKPAEWEDWEKNIRYDGLKRIESPAFAEQVLSSFYKDPQNEKFRSELYSMGLSIGILDPRNVPSQRNWKSEVWPAAIENIKLNDAVGLLWVGTREEKKEAEDYLLKWFRKPLRQPQVYLRSLTYRTYGVHY